MSAAALGASPPSGDGDGGGAGVCPASWGAVGAATVCGVRLGHGEVPAGLNGVLAGALGAILNVPWWGRVKETGLSIGLNAVPSPKALFSESFTILRKCF